MIRVALVFLALILAGCSSAPQTDYPEPDTQPAAPPAIIKDGTPEFRAELARVPDAIPRPEPLTAAGNKSPYEVLGTTYRVQPVVAGHRQRGMGSWYGTKFDRQKTSLGEDYDVYAMTAAHKTLPIPCYVRVTNLENGRRVVVRVNDRGPFHGDRIIDLSYAAAYRLGYSDKGTALLELEVLDPMAPEWVAMRGSRPSGGSANATPGERQTWLQAGAFRSLDSARSLQRDLAARFGSDVTVNSGNGWHRVRVGPLVTTSELEDARRILAAARLGTQVVTE